MCAVRRQQADAPARIARIAAEMGVARMVHISAIGADADSASEYARTKALGEAGVLARALRASREKIIVFLVTVLTLVLIIGLFDMLAQLIAAALQRVVEFQRIGQLTLLDPLTQISNLRGFERDIAREIARARRANKPLTVLAMEIDEYDDLHAHFQLARRDLDEAIGELPGMVEGNWTAVMQRLHSFKA